MRNDISDTRKAFERELQNTTGKPPQILTERLIDLVVAIRDELRARDGK